jgi:PilZ domain-containing protein
MAEARRKPRHHIVKAGTIKFGGHAVDCVVRNLSLTGAALEVPNTCAIPARFVLAMPGDGLQLPCRALWRRDGRIGIGFG